MILYQPFFIRGLGEEEKCRNSAFGAMFIFLVTFTSSCVYLIFDGYSRRRKLSYAAVNTENSDFLIPAGMSEYVVDNVELVKIQGELT